MRLRVLLIAISCATAGLAVRGASLAAFDRRCIPSPPHRANNARRGPRTGGVAPRSNTGGILTRRALPAGRIAGLGATPDLQHELLAVAVGAEDKVLFLFNGKDLAGWTQVGPGKFVIENGMLKTTGGMGLLYWRIGKLGNGVLRVVYKSEKVDSNSGVFIRIPEAPTEPWMPVNRGYEVEIDDAGEGYLATGVLYSLTDAKARPAKAGDWNTLEIHLEGPRTRVTLNGELVTDYREGEPVPEKHKPWEPDRGPRPADGFIGLQNHADKDVLFFKEVSFHSFER